jgi:hypothetical protein
VESGGECADCAEQLDGAVPERGVDHEQQCIRAFGGGELRIERNAGWGGGEREWSGVYDFWGNELGFGAGVDDEWGVEWWGDEWGDFEQAGSGDTGVDEWGEHVWRGGHGDDGWDEHNGVEHGGDGHEYGGVDGWDACERVWNPDGGDGSVDYEWDAVCAERCGNILSERANVDL